MRTAFVRSRCRSSPRGPRSCLGAGLRAVLTLGAYKVRQIWCSRYFLKKVRNSVECLVSYMPLARDFCKFARARVCPRATLRPRRTTEPQFRRCEPWSSAL